MQQQKNRTSRCDLSLSFTNTPRSIIDIINCDEQKLSFFCPPIGHWFYTNEIILQNTYQKLKKKRDLNSPTHHVLMVFSNSIFLCDSFTGCLTSVSSSRGLQVKCSHQLQAIMQLEAESWRMGGCETRHSLKMMFDSHLERALCQDIVCIQYAYACLWL